MLSAGKGKNCKEIQISFQPTGKMHAKMPLSKFKGTSRDSWDATLLNGILNGTECDCPPNCDDVTFHQVEIIRKINIQQL